MEFLFVPPSYINALFLGVQHEYCMKTWMRTEANAEAHDVVPNTRNRA